jgi:CheY-like chemotaxis protein
LASHADAEEAHASLRELGFGLLLIKPASPSAVFAIVARAFGAEQRGRMGRTAGRLNAVSPATWDQVRGVRVLLVEDNVINQEVAAAILKSAGVLVELANNGRDAVAKVRAAVQENCPFALVLMDRHMPGIDGLETTRQIRADPASADLPIVAMTADVVGSAREECLRAGMNAFVSKPFSPESLFPVVARWAKTSNTPPATEVKPSPPAPKQREALLPAALAGVDIEEGLARVAGNRALYLRLLHGFRETYPAADRRIRDLLAEGNLDDAVRAAHSIKSLAGQMGARELYRAAGRLEAALSSASPETDTALRLFADSLALVNNGLAELAQAEKPAVAEEEAPVSSAGQETSDHACP